MTMAGAKESDGNLSDQLNDPGGLYIADWRNRRIQKWSVDPNLIRTESLENICHGDYD